VRSCGLSAVIALSAAVITAPAAPAGQPPELSVVRTTSGALVSWNTGNGVPGAVYVVEQGGKEHLFARASSGSQAAPWVQPRERYVFRLYGEVGAKQLLVAVSIGTRTLTSRPRSVPDLTPPTTGHAVNVVLAFVPYLVLATLAALIIWHGTERSRVSRD